MPSKFTIGDNVEGGGQMSAEELAADPTVSETNTRVDATDRLREGVALAMRLVGPPESATERTPD